MNWARLDELRQEVGAEALDEVLEVFLEETDDVVARLKASAPGTDLEAQLHFLKGAALNIGFDELAALCAQGEALARAGRAGEVRIDAVLSCYARSRQELTDGRAA